MPIRQLGTVVCFVLSILCCSATSSYAQSLQTIDDLEAATQKRLDEGINMLGYTSMLYTQMDSLLNVVYKKLRNSLSTGDAEQLKQEQRAWLKQRDRYFRQAYLDTAKATGVKREDWGELEYLGVYQAETAFVRDRVIVLVKRLNRVQ